jgi:hypothetical protein
MHSASLHSFRNASRHFPHIKNFQQKIKIRKVLRFFAPFLGGFFCFKKG